MTGGRVGELLISKPINQEITKMKANICASLLLTAVITLPAFGAPITNGDFESCTFDGWQKDTDGWGDTSVGQDFVVTNAAGNCAGTIQIDSTETEAFFANTLFQSIDIGSASSLSFDITINSLLSSSSSGFIADYFVVAFGDGSGAFYDADAQLGTIIEQQINGLASFSLNIMLSEALSSMANLTLEFQLLPGVGIDGFTDGGLSSLTVDNVAFNTFDVTAPTTLFLISSSLLALSLRRRKTSRGDV